MPGAHGSRSRASRYGRVFVMAAGLACASLMLPVLPQTAFSAAKPVHTSAEISRPHVYLMRGLLNVFSLGMDQLAAAVQSHGIAADVYNHTVADSVVANIVAQYRAGDHGPYILVGHSLGADAVMMMAQSLNAQGVPVALVIPVDGTGSYAAPKNVACVLNLTQRSYAYMRPGSGFRGKLQNVDLSGEPGIDHLTIDKSPRVQSTALNSILQTAHAETCRPGATSPVVASPRRAPAPKVATPGEMPKPTEAAPGEPPKQSLDETPPGKALSLNFETQG
jgi:pimeloyl-ACP methyl ester carboxylesterase